MSVRFGILASEEVASAALCAAAQPRAGYTIAAILPVSASFQSYCRLLEEGVVDAIYLGEGTVRSFHRALAALASGIHVLYEDMPTASADEWDALACVARTQPAPALLASRRMLAPTNRSVSALARSGRLGGLRSFNAVVCTDEGDLHALALACVNHARELFHSEPVEVLAANRCEIPRVLSVALRFAPDRLAFVSCGSERSPSIRYDITGFGGDVRVSSIPTSSDLDEIVTTISGVSLGRRLPRASGLRFAMSHFASDIRCASVADSDSTPQSARSNARILRAIEQASRAERSVRVEPPPEVQTVLRSAALCRPLVKSIRARTSNEATSQPSLANSL